MATIAISEIMTTKVRTVRETDSVLLADFLLGLDGIHHAVVVDDARKVVGIVSDRDILRAFGSMPSGEMPIASFITRDVQTCTPETLATTALDQMLAGGFHALPVVAPDRHLIGIVTSRDFLEVARWVLGVTNRNATT